MMYNYDYIRTFIKKSTYLLQGGIFLKKIIALILAFCMIFLLSSCTDSEAYEKNNLFYFPIYPTVVYAPIEESTADVALEASRVLLNVEWQTYINNLGKDVCEFLNTLGANWKYEDIKVYSSNDLNIIVKNEGIEGVYRNYAIYLYPKTINLLDSPQNLSNEKKQIIAHELIHYMRELNNEKIWFLLSNERKEGEYTGIQAEECFVDTLSVKYMKSKGWDGETSLAYIYGDMSLELLELSIPNLFEFFFNNDVKGLEDEFNKLVFEHVNFQYDNPFAYWMCLIDYVISSSTIEKYASYFQDNFFCELEITASICSKEKKEEYVEIVNRYFNIVFKRDLEKSDMDHVIGLMY